jgi:outer membrane protein insertion porin family
VKINKLLHTTLFVLPFLIGCTTSRHVPEGKFLLNKSTITVTGDKINQDELREVLRIRENNSYLGLKFKLALYNAIDSTKVQQKRIKKNKKLRQKNIKISKKEQRINSKRIQKALKNNETTYRKRTFQRKDTLEPKRFFKEWLKYGMGESPIILDTQLVHRSTGQLHLYLRKKGYYYNTVTDSISYKPKHKKATVHYTIKTDKPYRIDSVFVIGDNSRLNNSVLNFFKRKEMLSKQAILDSDVLENLRSSLAREMRDSAYYDISANHFSYIIDTNKLEMKAVIGVSVKNKTVRFSPDSDSTFQKKHAKYRVGNVYFHIADTTLYKGNFKQKMDSLGLDLVKDYFIQTLDTLLYEPEDIRNAQRRKATFLYNGELALKPEILEMRNYLEDGHWYTGYYLERSYSQLLDMDVFQSIKPILVERPNSSIVDVHYYLVPAKIQAFNFEPRATNSNGYLGVSASVNYAHKNLFRGGEKFTLTFSGGFESQPPIFDEDITGKKIQTAARSFNTFEIGPTAKLELPGLRPIPPTFFSKRQATKTELSVAYNYQSRLDFKRNLFQMNYLWKWLSGKTQAFQMGLPFLTGVKYVQINKSDFFQQQLTNLNDLFLENAYSNQFIYHDLRLNYTWTNMKLESFKHLFSFNTSVDVAGNLLNWTTKNKTPNSSGVREVFGVPFSQFARIDNEIKMYQNLTKKKSLNYRLQLGAGLPYGNSQTSLPFDYSFFAGGTNDNRGWRARELGPGGYKYYLDTNRTATQIGDLRIGGTVEYRFNIGNGKMLKGAVFTDAGNVWSLREDINRIGGQFGPDWYKQIAVAGGVGIRFDLSFLIIRADLGIPIRNPAMEKGSQWIFNSRDAFYTELENFYGPDYMINYSIPRPFTPRFHIAIGYPF